MSSALHHTAEGGALWEADAEEVGAGREVGEIDLVGAHSLPYSTAGIVVDIDTEYAVGLDGDKS